MVQTKSPLTNIFSWRFFLSLVLFVAVLVIGIHAIPRKDLGKLTDFSKIMLVILMFFSLFISFLKAIRFYILLRNASLPGTFWQVYKVYMAGQATTLLPGGEGLRAILLETETKTPIIKASGPVITQAFLEFSSAAIITLFGSIFFEELRFPALLLLLIVGFVMSLFVYEPLLQFFYPLFKKTHQEKILKKFEQLQKNIRPNIVKKNAKTPSFAFFSTLLLAILTNGVGGVLVYLIAHSLSIHLSFVHSTLVYAATVVLSSVSGFIPAGVGVTEGGMMGVLLLLSVPLGTALSLVVVFRFITVIFYIVVGIFFFGIFYAKKVVLKK